MEDLNKIEIVGTVGSVRNTEVASGIAGRKLTSFTVATNLAYKGQDGQAIIETTWHRVAFWGEVNICKGCRVRVVGRVRNQKATAEDGTERIYSEILATFVEVL